MAGQYRCGRRKARCNCHYLPSRGAFWGSFPSLSLPGSAQTHLLAHGLQVIRTRLRQPVPPSGIPKYVSLVQAFQLVVKEEGWRALYGGMSPHLLRVVPNAITMFWVYERVIGLAEKRQAEKTRTDEEARIE